MRNLVGLGYARVDQVEDAGEFSVRGGIIDVFPVTERAPVRMEFWGDEVDSLRSFSVYSQRSLGPVETAHLYAAGERHGARPRSHHLPAARRDPGDPLRPGAGARPGRGLRSRSGRPAGRQRRGRRRGRRCGRRRSAGQDPSDCRRPGPRAGAVILRGRLRLRGLGHGHRRARLFAYGHLRRTRSCRARRCRVGRAGAAEAAGRRGRGAAALHPGHQRRAAGHQPARGRGGHPAAGGRWIPGGHRLRAAGRGRAGRLRAAPGHAARWPAPRTWATARGSRSWPGPSAVTS